MHRFDKLTRATSGCAEEYEKFREALIKQLKNYDDLLVVLQWCNEHDEPVSGYITTETKRQEDEDQESHGRSTKPRSKQ